MPAEERFRNNYSDPTQSGRDGFIAAPSDTEEQPFISRQLRLITEGDVEFVFAGYNDAGEPAPTIDDKILLSGLPAGTELNYAVRYICTGTTAQVLVVY